MSRKKRPSGHYDVGYGKPPKKHQFQKGHSGNKNGRPKGTVNKITEESVLTHIAREAYREVLVNDGTQKLTLPLVIVSIRSLMQKAAKGDLRAITKALELLEKVEERGASDKAMMASKANQSLEAYMNSLSLEELEEMETNFARANSLRKFSQQALWKAERAEKARLENEQQAASTKAPKILIKRIPNRTE